MSENPQSEESISEEFRKLGQNLVSALQTAWESPERKRLQEELTNGLNELGTTLSREVDQFSSSETGQRLKGDVEQLGDKITSSETTAKVRDELIHALQAANAELRKVVENWAERGAKTDTQENQQSASSETQVPGDKAS